MRVYCLYNKDVRLSLGSCENSIGHKVFGIDPTTFNYGIFLQLCVLEVRPMYGILCKVGSTPLVVYL